MWPGVGARHDAGMEILRQPSGAALVYCPPCLPAIAKLAPAHVGRQPTPVDPPPWCVYCHGCGQRLHQPEWCPTCPCPDQHWLATYDARQFGGALAHHLPRITNLDYAWTAGQDLCLAGIDPDHAATLAADLSSP